MQYRGLSNTVLRERKLGSDVFDVGEGASVECRHAPEPAGPPAAVCPSRAVDQAKTLDIFNVPSGGLGAGFDRPAAERYGQGAVAPLRA
jgi:hypothetical protein